MATGGKREAVDARIKGWERELERLRVALASAPESVHSQHNPAFVDLYQKKEVVKSRWEAIRGVYRPDPTAVRQFEEALAAIEAAWPVAQPMFAEILRPQAA
jgi:hypothetical protein